MFAIRAFLLKLQGNKGKHYTNPKNTLYFTEGCAVFFTTYICAHL